MALDPTRYGQSIANQFKGNGLSASEDSALETLWIAVCTADVNEYKTNGIVSSLITITPGQTCNFTGTSPAHPASQSTGTIA